jgi:rhodanese-related sulfurtransferase
LRLDRTETAPDHGGVASREVRGVDDLLAAARRRIDRLEPVDAWSAACAGDALVVDIRADDDRRRDGVVPGSLHVPRTVLEWRADPGSGWSNPHLARSDRRVVLLCTHGYSSSLAAAVLLDLGSEAATDVVGGFEAWRAAGLPVWPAPARAGGELAGMADPD